MEGLYKAVVVLPYQSGLPEDVTNNTFYFLADNPASTQAADITEMTNRVKEFYITNPTGETHPITYYIGDQVTRTANACKIVFYFNASIAPPALWGTPVGTSSFTAGASSGATRVPAEVAMVLSFHGDLTDIPETETNPSPPPAVIRPAARRRGRIFLGPLNLTAMSVAGSNADQEVSLGAITIVTKAASALQAHNNGDLDWVVASKAAGEVYEVIGGYMDNALDTQRRRGGPSSARTAWT